jgi:hypothetical protein
MAEAPRSGRGCSGFESLGRYALEGEPAGCRAPLLADAQETVAFRAWMVKLPGGSLRPETGWARERWGSGPPPSADKQLSRFEQLPGEARRPTQYNASGVAGAKDSAPGFYPDGSQFESGATHHAPTAS